jgi:LemA protein
MTAFIVVIVLLVLVAILIISIYNSLVSLRNKVKNSWSQIDVELQRRFDLIPNLVETVKGYMDHEEAVLTKVTELRTSWSNASSISEKAALDNELSNSVKSIMAVAENYPDLKANTNFLSLQEELSNTENKLSSSRNTYNNVTTAYNTKIEMFPSNIVANLFGFKQEELFKVESEEAKQNVKVQF